MVKRFPVILAVLPLSALSYGVVVRVARTEPGKGSRIFEPSSMEFANKAITAAQIGPSGAPPSAMRVVQPATVKVQWRTPSSFTAPLKPAQITNFGTPSNRLATLQGAKTEEPSAERHKLAWLQMLNELGMDRLTTPFAPKPSAGRGQEKPTSSPIPFQADTTYPYADGFSVKEETPLAAIMGQNESGAGNANPLRLNSPLRVVPEPASFFALAVGAAALIKRRRKSARV